MASSTATATASYSSIPNLIGEWVRQGTEGFIATQKILLDLAAQQNALALTILKERLGMSLPNVTGAVVDMIGNSIHNFMEAQRVLLDIASRENHIIVDGLKPGYAGSAVEGLAEVVRRGIDNFIAAQKLFLNQLEEHTEGAVTDYKAGKGFDKDRLGELAKDGVKDFLEAQKRFIGIIEDEMLADKARTAAEPGKRVDLFDMAQHSVDALVEAEKRLLDLVGDQVDVDVKFVREVMATRAEPRKTTTLPDLMKKSVDSFVAAQKALVELASKPRRVNGETAEREEPVVLAKG